MPSIQNETKTKHTEEEATFLVFDAIICPKNKIHKMEKEESEKSETQFARNWIAYATDRPASSIQQLWERCTSQ